MRVAVFSDVHAHLDALVAVLEAALAARVDELWFLGDVVGRGPDVVPVTRLIRDHCRVALAGNHDFAATGRTALGSYGDRSEGGRRSVELAALALREAGCFDWLRGRRPAAFRAGVQCWHGSPRHPVFEFVGSSNVAACLDAQRESLGLVGHTHVPAAWRAGSSRPVRLRVGEPVDVSDGKWMLNPGPVGAPSAGPGVDWWDGLDREAAMGAWWLELDLDARVAVWRRAPFDPAPARERASALGLV